MNYKNKSFISKRKAFTLIELLIVIAIIGILFVVLVSKVDFATDKAKTTGVQTDFRSFQVAFETVSRENSGFATLGWDTGDNAGGIAKDGPVTIGGVDYTYANADKDAGDRKRNSYDVGDLNLNGKCDADETFTGRRIYTETWTGIYTLDNPGNAADTSAYILLETAINKNLDPKLHITINPTDKTFNMKNGYQDPWTTEYHGFYLTNAAVDGKDRGAIVMYSNGPNKVFGSKQTIANGIVSVTVKNGAIQGQDDYSLVSLYTYINGYGEVKNVTTGFINNQTLLGNSNIIPTIPNIDSEPLEPPFNEIYEMVEGTQQVFNIESPSDLTFRSNADINKFQKVIIDGTIIAENNYVKSEGSTIITLKANYLNTLSNGDHDIYIVSNDGIAKTSFKVQRVFIENKSGLTITYTQDGDNIRFIAQVKRGYTFVNFQISGSYEVVEGTLNSTEIVIKLTGEKINITGRAQKQ